MIEAFGWAFLAASALLLGAGAALVMRVSEVLIGLALAFGAGALFSAVAFELTVEAFENGGAQLLAAGMAAGALTFFLGNRFLTALSNMATNLNLTDMETCSKAFRREVLQSVELHEDRFGFEPEITAKVARLGARVYEVGISYYGRTYEEGKKIGWRDGLRALWCILKYNLFQ